MSRSPELHRKRSDEASDLVRLHLGCGLTAPSTWVNLDRSPSLVLDRFRVVKWILHATGFLDQDHMSPWPKNILRHDVTKGLPFRSNSAEAIYSSHMLEHLFLNSARFVMRECHRVLIPGGILRLALPDAEQWIHDFVAGRTEKFDEPGLEFTHRLNAFPLDSPNLRRRLVAFFGANVHRWQPTRGLVRHLMREAGFTTITERGFLEGEMPGIAEVENRPGSLILEARKD